MAEKRPLNVDQLLDMWFSVHDVLTDEVIEGEVIEPDPPGMTWDNAFFQVNEMGLILPIPDTVRANG